MFVPKRVPHPNIIAFTEKVTNLEPEISPYFCKCIDHSLSHSIMHCKNFIWNMRVLSINMRLQVQLTAVGD